MNNTHFICKTCNKSTKRVIHGQCEDCYASAKDSKKRLKNEALDHVDNCMNLLGISIGLLDPKKALTGPAPAMEQMMLVETVKDDYKKLSDAVLALRQKGKNE